MAPHHRHSDSSEDEGSDAPEAVSLSQSKKHIQKLETTRKNAEIAQRQSKREKNRERDRKLKERAEKNKDEAAVRSSAKGKGKVVESQSRDDELQARMERAMQEAQEESSEDEDDDKAESSSQFEEFEGTSVNGEEDEDEDSSIDGDHTEEEDDDEPQAEDDSEDDAAHEEPPKSQKTRFNPDHLPDELFAAAFASKPKRKTLAEKTEKDNDATISRPKKKRKSSNIEKDVVIGYAISLIGLKTNLFIYIIAALAQFACSLTQHNHQYQLHFHHAKSSNSLTVRWLSKVANNERKDGNGDLVNSYSSSIVAFQIANNISRQRTLEYYVAMGLLCTSSGMHSRC